MLSLKRFSQKFIEQIVLSKHWHHTLMWENMYNIVILIFIFVVFLVWQFHSGVEMERSCGLRNPETNKIHGKLFLAITYHPYPMGAGLGLELVWRCEAALVVPEGFSIVAQHITSEIYLSAYNWLVSETVGSRVIMPKILPQPLHATSIFQATRNQMD